MGGGAVSVTVSRRQTLILKVTLSRKLAVDPDVIIEMLEDAVAAATNEALVQVNRV